MQDMYDIRLSIEPESARRAAARISKEELEKMREVLDLQRFYVEKEGESNSIQIKNLDSEFHELLYKASGSKAYFETLRSLHKKMTKFRKASVSKKSRALQSYAEHEEIYKALSDHDTDKAEKTVMTHVRNARGRMNSLED